MNFYIFAILAIFSVTLENARIPAAAAFTMSVLPSVAQKTRVLIVGTGLSGSLTCYHLRALAKKSVIPLRIDVADMARGPGGRMSTTRYGPEEIRANTGAQYLSTSSATAAALLQTVCASASPTHTPPNNSCPLDRVENPLRRSTHFVDSDNAYTHWLPRHGTNSAVKQFLYGGEPDRIVFESRLQRMAKDSTQRLVPLFDSGGTTSTYDIVILAMPPKDIIKFFNDDRRDSQSQADLHRRTNRGKKKARLSPDHRGVVLPPDVLRRLRGPSYVGRYSLALWLHDNEFADRAQEALNTRSENDPHPVLDMVSSQAGGVLVAQSTVKLWRQLTNSKGGGRHSAKSSILEALESLAGRKMPRIKKAKLLNWRTSQVNVDANAHGTGKGIVTAEDGRLIFTGDWCYESSFEGCNLAAEAAASAAIDTIVSSG